MFVSQAPRILVGVFGQPLVPGREGGASPLTLIRDTAVSHLRGNPDNDNLHCRFRSAPPLPWKGISDENLVSNPAADTD